MMTDSDDSPSRYPPNGTENADNNVQPFFVLHKPLARKTNTHAGVQKKTRWKVEFCSGLAASNGRDHVEEYGSEPFHENLRFESFEDVWLKIELSARDALMRVNINLFEEMLNWVKQLFAVIKSFKCSEADLLSPLPLLTNNISSHLFTAFVYTKNVEFVDDLLTFKELGEHLKSHSCHVANLSSTDFSVKGGIGACIQSLVRQLIVVTPSVADISILPSWYGEPTNYDRPILVIIEEMEKCNGVILAEFITLLSEYAGKLPMVLLMGVATTDEAPWKLLSSNALQKLHPCKFTIGSPVQRMNAVLECLLAHSFYGFDVGYDVAVFLRNYFFKYDATITSFVRALKIACAKHFFLEPLSFLCKGAANNNSKEFWNTASKTLTQDMQEHAYNLPSCSNYWRKGTSHELVIDVLPGALEELKKMRNSWSTVVMCLYEAGKFCKIHLLDIFCDALDPSSAKKYASSWEETVRTSRLASSRDCHKTSNTVKGVIIQVIHKIRDLPAASLCQLLDTWASYTQDLHEINEAVLKLLVKFRSGELGENFQHKDLLEGRVSQPLLHTKANRRTFNEDVQMLALRMIRDLLTPLESAPFHEIFCFKDAVMLQSALIGDPRRRIQEDFLKCQTYLNCSCCKRGAGSLKPSMHDTTILYILAEEQGDLINVYDWYQSFRSIFTKSVCEENKTGAKMTPKNRKASTTLDAFDEGSVQAMFCRAIAELQVTGLIRMPSKRRPDYVQRIALGL